MPPLSQKISLFDSLQREFCPPVDSSLIAALLAELEFDIDGNSLVVTEFQLETLRDTLREVATHAEYHVQEELPNISDLHLNDNGDATSSILNDDYADDCTSFTVTTQTTSCTTASDFSPFETSTGDTYPFSSPLGFLQTALPHVSVTRLAIALSDYGVEEKELDMWDVVATILSEEAVREMEERGLEGLDDEELSGEAPVSWTVVEKRRGNKPQRSAPLFSLGDVRQQNQRKARPGTRSSPSTELRASIPGPDPWVQLSSLSELASTLLSPHPSSFFLSFFHSPNYATPYLALRQALISICKKNDASSPIASGSNSSENSKDHTTPLFSILDIVLSADDAPLDPDEHSKLISDIDLSLRATDGRADDSLELVQLLRELDVDSTDGPQLMGVYHDSPRIMSTNASQVDTERIAIERPWQRSLPSEPPPVPPPPSKSASIYSALPTNERSSVRKPGPYAWKKVPERKGPSGPHPLAQSIPAYAQAKGKSANLRDARAVHDRAKFMRANAMMRKRDEFLREAARMWQRGNMKSRGGEIALYYAQRARECDEIARKQALEAARLSVEATRSHSANGDTIDLHGTTVDEAIDIVKGLLITSPPRPGS
ncbi:hypothetical protein HGRIS_004062 [Hohenbuehelia grisea]|uniref:DUF1771 domain-containing protein n=1 Tax=Hohenbuehelia grisea TaxID=104357 RepID=A0ABR3JJ23_9AGAR